MQGSSRFGGVLQELRGLRRRRTRRRCRCGRPGCRRRCRCRYCRFLPAPRNDGGEECRRDQDRDRPRRRGSTGNMSVEDLRLGNQAIHWQPLLSYPAGGNGQQFATLVARHGQATTKRGRRPWFRALVTAYPHPDSPAPTRNRTRVAALTASSPDHIGRSAATVTRGRSVIKSFP